MTFSYKILPVIDKLIESLSKIVGFPERKGTVSRKITRDQRKHKLDRRSSVRDGVIVSLSIYSDRRRGTDRRSV